MSGVWDIVKQMGLKKYDDVKDAYRKIGVSRVDENLPLGLRLNGMIEISAVDFILAGEKLKIRPPVSAEVIVSYGRFPIGGVIVHRFYFSSNEIPYMLQVAADPGGVIEECKVFMAYDEIYPQDWDFWLSEKDGYIGLNLFQLKDQTQYVRVWENDEREAVLDQNRDGGAITHIPPVQFLETLYYDPYGERTETLKHDAMLYGRHVDQDVDEYLLVAAVNENDGASVQIMVGLELSPASLKII